MSHMYPPEVTVLLSCYNGERWLSDAIESVINQSFEDFEFIVVDDGSTDDSLAIIKNYAVQDSRIIVIAKNNTGLADSLNVGIRKARGKWIARLDADDICLSMRLELQVATAKAKPDVIYIGTGLFQMDEVGNISKSFSYPRKHAALLKSLTHIGMFPAHSSAFYRADIVLEMGGYRPRVKRSQDWDLWLRLSEKGALTSIVEPLVKLRLHSGQISHEESGRRQIIDSRCAVTSYWIRSMEYPDPINADDITFASFHSWMTKRLEHEGLFDLYEYKSAIKTCFSERSKTPHVFLSKFFHIFSKPRLLLQCLRVHLFGESITRRLAVEWIASQKNRY
jgi:glycosyltransferase involved in cell wall biosynthesis